MTPLRTLAVTSFWVVCHYAPLLHADEATALDEPEPGAVAPASEPAPRVVAFDAQAQQLRLELQRVQAERAASTRLWPWLVTGAGVGAALASSVVGAGYALSCEDNCLTPAWVSVTVVIGAAFGVLGTIWVVHTDRDIRQVESRKYKLERELERFDRSSQRQRMQARSEPQFSLRLAL